MKIGFTGAREGMTEQQAAKVYALIRELRPLELHHGDCVGADARFHYLASLYCAGAVTVRERKVVIHPPADKRMRASCLGDETREPKPYLDRNRDIVDETDVLIAAPKTATAPASLKGQGTWSTVFYALKRRKTVYLVAPDGTVGTPVA